MAKPVFIAGKNRSGTKWLSNILLNNKEICGIQDDYHGGIVETNVLNDMPRIFGPLSNKDSFVGCVECFCGMDFFRLSQASKAELYRARPKNYYEFLRKFMDIHAREANTPFWLQKIDIKQLKGVYEHFGDAKFVVIERDVVDNIKSAVALQKKNKLRPSILRETILYAYSLKSANRYRDGKKNVFFVKYEDIKGGEGKALRGICDFLGVDYSRDMLSVKFKKNTSFDDPKDRDTFFSSRDVLTIKSLSTTLKIVPLWLYEFVYQLLGSGAKAKPFQRDTFHMTCNDFRISDVDTN